MCVPKEPPTLPLISVIVPVRNEASFIGNTLQQLLHQDYDPERYEVLVADGRSTDDTAAIVRLMQTDHPNLRLLPNPRRWSSAGRNEALRAARGDIVVVVDGHCALDDRGYLRNLADAFARSGADCVGRPQPLDVAEATTVQRAIALARSSRLGHHPDSYIYSSEEKFVQPQSVAVAYRRAVFDTVGTFDETFDACEDVEFNHRIASAGLSCFFTPRVAVSYYPRASLGALFRQMVRYGRGRVRLLRKHPQTFTPLGFIPAAFILGLIAGAMLTPFSSFLAAAYGSVVALYVLTVGLTSTALASRERDLRLLPWLPLVFFTIHAGAGCGILQEWLARQKPKTAVTPRRPVTTRKPMERPRRVTA